MTETMTKIAWIALALIHATPALAVFAPQTVARLYGVAPDGDLGVLLVHRGALFLAIVVGCLWAAVDGSARRVTSVLVTISVVGFLIVYWRSGAPVGPLRKIALVDAVALAPLAFVLVRAWRI